MTLCKSGTWVKSICCIELMVILYLMSQNGNLYCGHNDLCFIFFIPLWLMSVSFSWPSIYYSVEPLLLFFTAFIKLSSIFSSTHSCCRFFFFFFLSFYFCCVNIGRYPLEPHLDQSGTSPLYVVSIHDALPGARWENVPKKKPTWRPVVITGGRQCVSHSSLWSHLWVSRMISHLQSVLMGFVALSHMKRHNNN